jgi:hypothetical protein
VKVHILATDSLTENFNKDANNEGEIVVCRKVEVWTNFAKVFSGCTSHAGIYGFRDAQVKTI